jgi:hypothetical protein
VELSAPPVPALSSGTGAEPLREREEPLEAAPGPRVALEERADLCVHRRPFLEGTLPSALEDGIVDDER